MKDRRFVASRGFKSAFLISAGTLVGQAVTFVALPFVSRLFTPAEFGVYSLALTIASLALPLAILRFDKALLLPVDDGTVKSMIVAALSFSAIVSVLLGIITCFTGILGSTGIHALLLALLLFANSFVALMLPMASRAARYGSLGFRTATQSISGTAVQISTGMLGVGGSGLLIGSVAGSAVGAGLLSRFARRLRGRVTIRSTLKSVQEYWRFPVVFVPISFMTLFAQQAPIIFSSMNFGDAATGAVGMAERLVAVPVALIGLAVGVVFEGEMSRSLRTGSGDPKALYLKTSSVLAVIGLFAGIFLAFVAPNVISILLGDEWVVAGRIAQAMCVVVLTRLVVSATRNVTQLLQRGLSSILLECFRLILILAIIGISIWRSWDLVTALWYLYLAMAVADVLTWIWGYRVVSRLPKELSE